MSWDADFYTAVMGNATFAQDIDSLAYEYKADAKPPFANYQLISADSCDELDGAGFEGTRRIRLEVWADNPTDAKTLCVAGVTGAQATLEVTNVFQRSLGRDDKEKVFGYAADLMIWWDTP